MHQGTGTGLTARTIGEAAGEETVQLTSAQIPAHTHTATANCVSGAGNTNVPTGKVWAKDPGAANTIYSSTAANATLASGAVTVAANTGGGQAHDNMPPFLVVNFCIAQFGIFPARS
jgi:microcystin-dependent protein